MQHKLNYYTDNRVQVAYCEVCSAEGEALLCDCHGEVIAPSTQPKDKDIVGKSIDRLEA